MSLFGGMSNEDKQEIVDAAIQQFENSTDEIIAEVARRLLDNQPLLEAALKKVLTEDPVIQDVKTRAQKEAEEPWVEVKGMVHDPVNGIKLELDWNAGFVLYLKQQGFNGVNDEEIVQRYLAYMYKDIHDQMAGDEEAYE